MMSSALFSILRETSERSEGILSPAFLLFGVGLAVGSFFNAVAFRFPSYRNIVNGRSFCFSCKHPLRWHDLIPLASFIALGGKCRYCKKKISVQYPVVELATGILFLTIFFSLQNSSLFDLFFWLLLGGLLMLIAVFDIRYKLIPTGLLLISVAIGLFYTGLPFGLAKLFGIFLQTSQANQTIQTLFLAALMNAAFILFLVVTTKERGMGMGDVPIAFLQGLLLGYPKGLIALFLSFIIGSIIGIALIISKKAGLKSEVPFAPFLILALFIIKFFNVPFLTS